MGKANRERRRAQQIKRRRVRKSREASGRVKPRHTASDLPLDEIVDLALFRAAHRGCGEADAHGERSVLVHDLVSGFSLPGGRELVAGRLRDVVVTDLTQLRRVGWRADDLVKVVRRKAGATACAMVAGMLPRMDGSADSWRLDEADGPSSRARVLDAASPNWASELLATLDAVAVLEHLPELPDLGVPAGRAEPQSADEERVLARIRALLAKAESSEYPEEADAFTAKAQKLVTQHCIDRALLEGSADAPSRHAIEARRVWLDDPYLQAKGMLLAEVAAANRCRAVLSTALGFSTIVGDRTDLDAAELLFTSLLVQATKRITALGRAPDGSRARRPSFRRSFFVSYAGRIGARLREANSVVTAEAEQSLGSRLLPVLARREDEVDETVRRLFGQLANIDCAPTDLAGWVAGAAAADLADLAIQETLFEAAS
jgi:Protein of unknown function (DUF2786)